MLLRTLQACCYEPFRHAATNTSGMLLRTSEPLQLLRHAGIRMTTPLHQTLSETLCHKAALELVRLRLSHVIIAFRLLRCECGKHRVNAGKRVVHLDVGVQHQYLYFCTCQASKLTHAHPDFVTPHKVSEVQKALLSQNRADAKVWPFNCYH